jgi:glycosyltransferase involved in cell wall biosynthesis
MTTHKDSERINVIFDHTIFKGLSYGGIPRYICMLAEELSKLPNVYVTVLGGYTDNHYIHELKPHTQLNVVYWKRKSKLKLRSFMKFWFNFLAKHVLKKLAKDDCSLIYHPTYLETIPEFHKQATCTVCTVHDMIPELFKKEYAGSWYVPAKKEQIALAHAIIPVSQSTANDLVRLYPQVASKVNVILSGLKTPSTQHHTQPPFTQPYFLMIGERGGTKNGIHAFAAFNETVKIFPNTLLVACGKASLRSNELEFIAAHNLQNNILHRSPTDEELDALYQHAQGLIYPTRYEGFGFPVLEAMQRNCPVITCNVSSIPEVGGNAVLYTDPDDVAKTASLMKRLLNEPALREDLIRKGREQAKQFSPKHMAEETLNVYRKAIQERI